jgi:integrase
MSPDTTVKELMTDFLWTFKKPTVSAVTFEWYRNITETHINTPLGNISAIELTPQMIQTHINKMHGEDGLEVRTIKAMRDTLNQAYNHAIDIKQAKVNPVSGTRLPKQSRMQIEKKAENKAIPTMARAEILKAAESNKCIKTAITVLMLTGMRVGEWLALTWGQVDFENNVIIIDRAITKSYEYDEEGKLTGNESIVGDTKTQCSIRKIKVSEVVITILRDWQKTLPDHVRKSVKHDVLSSECVVFPNNLGKMRTYNGFRSTYRRFMDKNGLGDYSLHSYRHTFSTILLEENVNPKVVQKLLGHSDIETTLGTYSHVLPEVFDGVAGIVSKVHIDMMSGTKKVPQLLETQSVA